jgi:hypothetical protein
MAGTQFCPRCVGALESIVAADIDPPQSSAENAAAVAIAS